MCALGCKVCVEEAVCKDLLLETLVVTAVTEAREMVSGSSPPPNRMALRSMSSVSKTAGSSEKHKGGEGLSV